MLNSLLKMLTKKPEQKRKIQEKSKATSNSKTKVTSGRIGEIGEYKINIQLDQLPADCKTLSDIMIENVRSSTGYSQIDHIVIHPYGIFVIETKNYSGRIKGKKNYKSWYVNGKFPMYNPLRQNKGHIHALKRVLNDFPSLTYISIISFNMRARFNVDPELRKIESNELVVYDTELSEYLSRKINRLRVTKPESMLDGKIVEQIYNIILEANITDVTKREEQVRKINSST